MIIDKAVQVLRAGGLVALPTETVYGLGADARNPEALARIFKAKNRPADHPLIVHLANPNQLPEWVKEIPPQALILAKAFWPGPLTLIFKKAPGVLDLITGNQDTIGIRIPKHPLTLAVLELFGGGVAAPSANRFGRISPTTASAVREELGDAVDLILEGGQCEVGLESTIIDVTKAKPTILRPGIIHRQQVETLLKQSLALPGISKPRVSGSLESHYSPSTPATLVATEKLQEYLATVAVHPVGVICRSHLSFNQPGIDIISMPTQVNQYAHSLYSVLREADKRHFQQIIIETVPQDPIWDGVRDRLERACAR